MLKTTCGNCPAGCGMKVFKKDNRIVDIFGDEDHPVNKGSLCPKGLLAYDHLANPYRLMRPGIRESLDEPFREVSWEEALAFTSRKLSETIEASGPDSIHVHGTESSPFDYLAGANLFCRHVQTPNDPSRYFPRAFSPAGSLKEMFGVPGSQLLMNSPRDWCNSRCILLYGSDLAASDPITMGSLIDARDRGVMLIAIDSRKTVTTSRASLSVRIKPGSGAALLKGILRILIGGGSLNSSFVREWTEGFERLKARVEPCTPEWVAERCWIQTDELHHLAKTLGERHPLQVMSGDWFTRRFLTDEELVLCGALVALNGSPGMSGGGLNLLASSPFSWTPGTDGAAPVKPLHLETALLDSSAPPRALVWQGNAYAGLTGGKEVDAALRKVPFIVHFSLFPNAAVRHSHVSLPMASWLERSCLTAAGNGRSLQWQNKVLDPPGECRPALELWTELAGAVRPGFVPPCPVEENADGARSAADCFLALNPLTSRVQTGLLDPATNPPGGLLWPCIEERDLEFETTRLIKGNVRGRNILFQNGRNYPFSENRFPTPSGKIALSPDGAVRAPEENEDPQLPLLLCTGVPVDYVEDFACFASDGEPDRPRLAAVRMHPSVARTIDVDNGDQVTVENGRGSFSAPVWLTVDVDPRTIWYPYGADEFQSSFRGPSLSRLFPAPEPGSASPSHTRVAVYGARHGRTGCTDRIREFIDKLEAGSTKK